MELFQACFLITQAQVISTFFLTRSSSWSHHNTSAAYLIYVCLLFIVYTIECLHHSVQFWTCFLHSFGRFATNIFDIESKDNKYFRCWSKKDILFNKIYIYNINKVKKKLSQNRKRQTLHLLTFYSEKEIPTVALKRKVCLNETTHMNAKIFIHTMWKKNTKEVNRLI